MAYKRWLTSVKVVEPGDRSIPTDLPVASEQETKAVERLLGAIEEAFEDAKKYMVQDEPEAVPVTAGGRRDLDDLARSARETARKYQKGKSTFEKPRWVTHDSKVLHKLTERVSQY